MSASSDFDPHPSSPEGEGRHSTATQPHLFAAVPDSALVGAFNTG